MEQIKVYGTKWCPDCHRAKQVFEQLNVQYNWIDIEDDQDALAYLKNVNNGFHSVPTIVFPDGSILVEPGNKELEKKLAGVK